MAASASSPAAPPPTLRKSMSSSQSSKTQTSIAGFFKKAPTTDTARPASVALPINNKVKSGGGKKNAQTSKHDHPTPAPSSDAVDPMDDVENRAPGATKVDLPNPLPSPITPAEMTNKTQQRDEKLLQDFSSPSRKVRDTSSLAGREVDYILPG